MSAKAICVNRSEVNYWEERRSDELCIAHFEQEHTSTSLYPMSDLDIMSYTDVRV